MTKKHYLIGFIIATPILIAVALAIVFNFTTIKDFFTGLGYRPSAKMAEIRTSLDLTDTGQRIFNATLPELMEKQAFNQTCRALETENAILGCYKNDRIYIYNITDDELDGILELTSAHELLHAAYSRMSTYEKQNLTAILEDTYTKNQAVLGEEIDLYEDADRLEELYVRIGTEIANLPESLESHYAKFFKNQDKIANFYQSYIAIFRGIERNLRDLLAKITARESDINAKTAAYEEEVKNLNQDIEEFNNCAKTPDCFTSNWAFNTKRQALLSREDALTKAYEEINSLINEYNTFIAEYNENALHGQTLNMAINSSTQVEGL